ncbi:MAG TPA: hypothetical protein VGK93_04175 [Candidatus Eisenbacteria bacterium]
MTPTRRYANELETVGFFYPLALRRLVLLYAGLGRISEARERWRTFSETFVRPDPDLEPLVEEARSALLAAEAMSGAARR